MRDERQPNEHPVETLAAGRLALGGGKLAVALGADWDAPSTRPTAALLVLHGRLRNACDYLHTAEAAIGNRPGWLALAPQFPAAIDLSFHDASPDILHWDLTSWMGGGVGIGRHRVSAFAALDAVLARLAVMPGMGRVVVAGHSGGGQVVQRYALLGNAGPHIRYVIANPSSYAFPDTWRPGPPCPGMNTWKYGLDDLPPGITALDRDALLDRYAARDVHYVVGELDTDPAHPALDRTPQALAQGPHRRARAEAFVGALRRCRPGCGHSFQIVPGAGHDGRQIMTSRAAASIIFD